MMSADCRSLTRWQERVDGYIPTRMSTVQEIKSTIKALADADFREVSRAVDEMEAEAVARKLSR